MKNEEKLEAVRHSLSHIMSMAVQELYPRVGLGVGPAIENGFYQDYDLPETISPEILPRLEKRMKELIKENITFDQHDVDFNEAYEFYKHDPYKTEFIDDLKTAGEKKVSFYKSGRFDNLCAGPHVISTKEIDPDAFKLTKLAGAYWRGDEKNKMLQRIYGVAFANKKELDAYLKMQEEAEKRDHRKIGAEQELFTFSPDVGSGLVIWLPKGNIIKEELEKWAKETEEKLGYERVTTPIITKENLFYISEHLPHYKESMYSPMDIDGEKYYIKPMNCPFHHTIFKHRTRSYRELPLRLAEYGWCHRYEDSGSLFGLMRVRGMQMNDAHIYCAKDQAVKEFVDVIKLHEYYYQQLGIKDYYMELALRNPENKKYHGDDEMWKEAEALMKEAMDISKVPYIVQNDGAAFYGPKIDFQIKSITGRVFTASTNQIDLFMPKKFDLKYADKDGKEKFAVCIHRAPLGTHERFIGFLIEHFAGAWPVWLSPVQVKIISVGENHIEFSSKLAEELKAKGIRADADIGGETVGNKIRKAGGEKIPYVVVIGDKEVSGEKFAVRVRGVKELRLMEKEELIGEVKDKIEKRLAE